LDLDGSSTKADPPDPRRFTEEEFQTLLCTTEEGTGPEHLVVVARALGLEAEAHEGLTVEDLDVATAAGQPVLCCVQYQGEGWEDGHWVVTTGVDDSNVYVQDPVDGPKRIGRRLWERRWKDEGVDGTRYTRYGIVLSLPAEEKSTKIAGE
jgi:predicted double-glycine peptidase